MTFHMLDRELAAKAEAQHGVIAHWQISRTDPRHVVHRRFNTGRWEPLAKGVYRLAGSPRTWRQALLAAVFAAGPGAVASHRAAAALWDIPGFGAGPLDVLRPRHTDHRSTLGPVHETRVLPDELLDERGAVPAAESELERRLLVTLAEGGLPPPRRQVHAGGCDPAGRVDFVYADARLVIEADTRRHHMSKLDFENDRQRDNTLMADGWRVLRISWQQVTDRPNEVARLVRQALSKAA
ncbi:MAG TPA: DUF559 domain-containing protein [Acidimicrobiales bacterium]|nr:DUF559 domain-containing protein [Acidimicrobiales bacterium]